MKSEQEADPHHYDDIMDLPHHVSLSHTSMPVSDRAAQFLPFAALTGYDAAIQEAARLTDERAELAEDRSAVLDEQLLQLEAQAEGHPEVTITFFVPDERKRGGAYRTVSGLLKKFDRYEGILILADGTRISAEDIIEIAEID